MSQGTFGTFCYLLRIELALKTDADSTEEAIRAMGAGVNTRMSRDESRQKRIKGTHSRAEFKFLVLETVGAGPASDTSVGLLPHFEERGRRMANEEAKLRVHHQRAHPERWDPRGVRQTGLGSTTPRSG